MEESTTSHSGDGADTSGGRFDRAKDFVGSRYSAASDAMKDTYSSVRGKIDEVDFEGLADQLRSYIRSHPGKALLVSVGVGFLVGLMLRRSEEEDDE